VSGRKSDFCSFGKKYSRRVFRVVSWAVRVPPKAASEGLRCNSVKGFLHIDMSWASLFFAYHSLIFHNALWLSWFRL
jgi:hypothetical protein